MTLVGEVGVVGVGAMVALVGVMGVGSVIPVVGVRTYIHTYILILYSFDVLIFRFIGSVF